MLARVNDQSNQIMQEGVGLIINSIVQNNIAKVTYNFKPGPTTTEKTEEEQIAEAEDNETFNFNLKFTLTASYHQTNDLTRLESEKNNSISSDEHANRSMTNSTQNYGNKHSPNHNL